MRKAPSIKTVKMLYATSGGICAYPECNTKLVDPTSGALLGEMCHITAASEGGPRYDPSLSDNERNEIDNLIILCPTHHSLIDQDSNNYPADKLRQIKVEHEHRIAKIVTSSPESIENKQAIDFSRQVEDEGVDFAIIVALPKELNALKEYFPEFQPIQVNKGQSRTYYTANIPTINGGTYRVVTTLLNSMGNLEAAHATSDLINIWNPRYVLVNGIAGGLRKSDQSFGDIVVSDSILYYELGKITKIETEHRNKQFPSDQTLLGGILNFENCNWRYNLPNRPDGHPPSDCYPKIHIGPIASGEKVIADINSANQLRQQQRNLIAVEMESAGVASAAFSTLKKVGFIAVRSICDFADESKNDSWHEYAAKSAASYLRAFLESQPIATSEGRWPNAAIPISVIEGKVSLDVRRQLFDSICKAVDLEEFKNFCFLIGVDFDELPGDRKSAHVRELIQLFERRGEINVLFDSVTELIPNLTDPINTGNSHDVYAPPKDVITDKWVSTEYVERSGILEELQEEGYDIRWTTAKQEAVRVDLEGWEQVLLSQSDGTQARLKIQDSPAIGGYLILLKKKNK